MIFNKKISGAEEQPVLIVGLGNPGRTYELTRHNVGFQALDIIAGKLNIQIKKNKFQAVIGEGRYQNRNVILAKPQTFMNLSGEAVFAAQKFYKPDIKDIILIYDDVDIPLGLIRVRPFGSPGTHNGMRSVTHALNSDRFPRIRIGIGKPYEFVDISDFVLTRFANDERDQVLKAIEQAANAAVDIMMFGVEKSMNLHNMKKKVENEHC